MSNLRELLTSTPPSAKYTDATAVIVITRNDHLGVCIYFGA